MACYLGLDLGGTNVKAGLLDDTARVLAKISTPTHAEHGPDAVIEAMIEAGKTVAAHAGVPLEQIDAVGIGSPGPMDLDAGVIRDMPNLPGWDHVPLRDRIATGLGRPTVLENDANAAAFGEYWAGAGRDPKIHHLVMLTLGTGIGTGIIIDGVLLHGSNSLGAEGGHMILVPDGRRCGCGQRGCLEAYASASNTATRAIEALEAGHDGTTSALASLRRAQAGRLTAKDIFDAAKTGDTLATEIAEQTANYLGIACASLCRLFDPQMIVFAGGMILAGDYLFEMIREAFARHTWKLVKDHVRIVPAELGNDAGFIGAAAVARDADQRGRLHAPLTSRKRLTR